MKMTTAMKMILGSFAVCLALNALADDPTIGQVTVKQRWPWSRLVDIDYVLSCDPTQKVDIAISAYNGSTALMLPTESLSGDLYGISEGAHRIVFDPTKTAYTNSEVMTKFRVAIAQNPVPVYMIVDLTKSAGAGGQIEYIYPGDARLETYGRFTNVWFGVTNDSVYATDKFVLRRVSAGSYGMGDNVNIPVTLTKDFYVSVFELTETQWFKIMGSGSMSTKPKVNVSYDDIRGSTNNMPVINWYTTGSTVGATNFMGVLRSRTIMSTFDLPTEAQWEYVCRAGTTTYFSDGITGSSTNQLNDLGWWNGNCVSLQLVGQKMANNWGLYDTHGNAIEWSLDWEGTRVGGSDPAGAVSGIGRVTRGGSWRNPATSCRSSGRSLSGVSGRTDFIGFRVVRNLP